MDTLERLKRQTIGLHVKVSALVVVALFALGIITAFSNYVLIQNTQYAGDFEAFIQTVVHA